VQKPTRAGKKTKKKSDFGHISKIYIDSRRLVGLKPRWGLGKNRRQGLYEKNVPSRSIAANAMRFGAQKPSNKRVKQKRYEPKVA